MLRLEGLLDTLEQSIFRNEKDVLKDLYQLKRRSTVYRHMLFLTSEMLHKYAEMKTKVSDEEIEKKEGDPYIQSLVEEVTRLSFKSEELYDNITNLLNLFLSLASHRYKKLVINSTFSQNK